MKRLLLLCLALLFGLAAACGGGERSGPQAPGPLEVHFFDVGQGDGIFIRSPEGRAMVVDGGPRDSGFAGYLAKQGVKEVDLLVGTHPDADHIGGLIRVLGQFKVKEVWTDGQPHTTRTYEAFLDAIARSGAAFHEARRSDTFRLGSVAVHILHPPDPLLPGENDVNSVVVKVVYGEVSVLLTGDGTAASERSMLSGGLDLRSTVLKLGHHGSRSSTSAAFLRAVSPQVAVYQAGRSNPYGHPHREVVTRVTEAGIALYGTDVSGTIVLTTDGKTYSVRTERGR